MTFIASVRSMMRYAPRRSDTYLANSDLICFEMSKLSKMGTVPL